MSSLCDCRPTAQPNRSRTTNQQVVQKEEDHIEEGSEGVQEVVTSAVTACPAAVAEKNDAAQLHYNATKL